MKDQPQNQQAASANQPVRKSLAIQQIIADESIQPRAEIRPDVAKEYADVLLAGGEMPALVVFFDGKHYWLSEGFHRRKAHELANNTQVVCDVYKGGKRDAMLYAAGSNAAHGLRRTNADKRRAVEMLLKDKEWGGYSNHWIAEKCAVSDEFVRQVREDQVPTVGTSTTRIGRDGKQYPVNKGNAKSPEAADGADQNDESDEGSTDNEPESNEPEPVAPPTLEQQVEALPLFDALSHYGHAGKLFRDQAVLWLKNEDLIKKVRAQANGASLLTGAVADALKALGSIEHPSKWEGCAACKGSGRVGERHDPCNLCRGGFTVQSGEGVSADVVIARATAGLDTQ